MLRITSNESAHNCEGASRREFLRIGALGLGGLTLPQLLDIPNLRLRTNLPDDIQRVITNSRPIPQLI